MEVVKVNTPVTAYQGSGAETAVRAEVEQSSAVQAERKTVAENFTSDSEKQNLTDSGEKAANGNIKRAVEEVNRKANNSELIFGVHDATNRVTIKVVDKSTKEVIREFPPEETLDMIAKVWELAGIMVDERR